MLQARSSGDVNQHCFPEIWTDSALHTLYSFSAHLQYHNHLVTLINFPGVLCNAASASSPPQIVLILFLFHLFIYLFIFIAVTAPCPLSKSAACYFKNEIKLVFIVTVNNTTAL